MWDWRVHISSLTAESNFTQMRKKTLVDHDYVIVISEACTKLAGGDVAAAAAFTSYVRGSSSMVIVFQLSAASLEFVLNRTLSARLNVEIYRGDMLLFAPIEIAMHPDPGRFCHDKSFAVVRHVFKV